MPSLFVITTNWKQPKWIVTYIFNNILYSDDNGQNLATCNNKEESQKHNAEWIVHTQRCTCCIIPVIQSLKFARKNWCDRRHMVSGVLFLDSDFGYVHVAKVLSDIPLKYSHFSVCILYIKKDLLKVFKIKTSNVKYCIFPFL